MDECSSDLQRPTTTPFEPARTTMVNAAKDAMDDGDGIEREAVSHVSELGAVSIYTPGQNGPLRLLQSFALLAPPHRPHRRPRRPAAPRPRLQHAPRRKRPDYFACLLHHCEPPPKPIIGLSIPHKPRLSRISSSFSISCRLPAFLPPHALCRRRLFHDEPNTRQSLTTSAVCAQHQPSHSQRSVNTWGYTSTVTTSNSFNRCSTAVYANIW